MVLLRNPVLPEAGGFVQRRGCLPAPDAQGGHSADGAENLLLLPGHVPSVPGGPAQGQEDDRRLVSTSSPTIADRCPSSQVNEKAGNIIQYGKFYIHELDDLVDIKNDYVTWIQRQMYPMVSLLLVSIPGLAGGRLPVLDVFGPALCVLRLVTAA